VKNLEEARKTEWYELEDAEVLIRDFEGHVERLRDGGIVGSKGELVDDMGKVHHYIRDKRSERSRFCYQHRHPLPQIPAATCLICPFHISLLSLMISSFSGARHGKERGQISRRTFAPAIFPSILDESRLFLPGTAPPKKRKPAQ
jgi:hypothetical protein